MSHFCSTFLMLVNVISMMYAEDVPLRLSIFHLTSDI